MFMLSIVPQHCLILRSTLSREQASTPLGHLALLLLPANGTATGFECSHKEQEVTDLMAIAVQRSDVSISVH
jgi:hypothetical protein